MSYLSPPLPPPRSQRPLAVVHAEIARARREVAEAWSEASSADRIFAVERLVREDRTEPELAARLAALQLRVRSAWVEARVAGLAGGASTAARQAGLRLLLAERELDALIDEGPLGDALFLAAEGFLRRVPAARGRSLRELVRERDREREHLVHFLPAQEGAR